MLKAVQSGARRPRRRRRRSCVEPETFNVGDSVGASRFRVVGPVRQARAYGIKERRSREGGRERVWVLTVKTVVESQSTQWCSQRRSSVVVVGSKSGGAKRKANDSTSRAAGRACTAFSTTADKPQ